jgi:hypothetical protein
MIIIILDIHNILCTYCCCRCAAAFVIMIGRFQKITFQTNHLSVSSQAPLSPSFHPCSFEFSNLDAVLCINFIVMSTLSSSPALTSRVTPRSPKKWRSPAKRSSNDKASANFVNSLSSPQHRSPQKQGVVKPEANPRALIDRLSPSTFTGTQGARRRPKPLPSVRSPTGLLDKLMKSEVLSAMLSSEVNTPMDTSGSEQNDAMLTSTSTDDNRNIVCILRTDLHAAILCHNANVSYRPRKDLLLPRQRPPKT